MKSLSGMERWEPAPSLPASSPSLTPQLSGTSGEGHSRTLAPPSNLSNLPASLLRGELSGKVGEMGEVDSVMKRSVLPLDAEWGHHAFGLGTLDWLRQLSTS